MKRFYSISSHPGKTGTHYYNGAFSRLGIDATYHAIGTTDLTSAMHDLVSSQDVAGFSVSMPFKRSVIRHLDVPDQLVTRYNSCNTVVIRDGKLYGYNCDHAGAEHVLRLAGDYRSAAVLGNGAMGSMMSAMIGPRCRVFSRSSGNWSARHASADLIINATAVGTANGDSPLDGINAGTVIDLAMKPGKLRSQCLESGVTYIPGLEFYKYQFMRQFKHYTSMELDPFLFDELSGKLNDATS